MPGALPGSLVPRPGRRTQPGHIYIAGGQVFSTAQSQILLRPRGGQLRSAAALHVGRAALRHGGRGLSPPNDLSTTVQFRAAPLPPRPIWGQVPLRKGAWARS